MNRYLFTEELKRRLQRLPYNEIKNALDYYEEYFDDAGTENEQKVIEELGNPANIASQIIADFAIKDMSNANPSAKKGLSTLWLVILAIFASPIALPLAFAVVMVVFSIILAMFALIFSFGVTGIALVASGILSVLASLTIIIKDFPTSIYFIGAGFVFFGVGLALFTSTTLLSKKCFGWLANLSSKFLKRRSKN